MSNLPPPPPDELSSQPPPPTGPPAYGGPQAATGWATLGIGETVELAGPGRRLGARLIDAVIVGVGVFILLAIGVMAALGLAEDDTATDEEAAAEVAALFGTAIAAAVIGILYEVTMIALKGQTLGKMATGVKVVRSDNGLVPGWGKSVGRWIIPTVLAFIPFVGWLLSLLVYLSLLWDNARQGWHDKAAGTLVIKV